ncbi:hypothetical protein [Coprococcus sp. OM06-25]|uniref:hypothetical protein n=1 Tax=Coprococcus sp. OM06-25 TaxID=2293094 RepID=UPI001FA8F2FF|nr:hypothetical protein [Coprococcus sp. OM06-25]
MATVYNVMLYGGLALAIVFAIVAVVLFFVLKIPKAVGIATGSTARKKIDEIKEKAMRVYREAVPPNRRRSRTIHPEFR